MFFRQKVQCPACQGFRCRESRWRTVEEKRVYPGCVPYRCLDCSHRFLAPQRKQSASLQRISAAAVLVGTIVVFAAASMLTGKDIPPSDSVATTHTLLDLGVRKAAEEGDAAAQFRLGEALFHDPARTNETSVQAINWLQRSAENGNTDAMIFLGRLSRTGVGILQDFAQASVWLHTAAQRGSPEGMLELGRLYRDGVGVEKDLVKAYVWFNRAAAARNLDAVREREAIARVLKPDELKDAQRQSAAMPSQGDKASMKSASN